MLHQLLLLRASQASVAQSRLFHHLSERDAAMSAAVRLAWVRWLVLESVQLDLKYFVEVFSRDAAGSTRSPETHQCQEYRLGETLACLHVWSMRFVAGLIGIMQSVTPVHTGRMIVFYMLKSSVVGTGVISVAPTDSPKTSKRVKCWQIVFLSSSGPRHTQPNTEGQHSQTFKHNESFRNHRST